MQKFFSSTTKCVTLRASFHRFYSSSSSTVPTFVQRGPKVALILQDMQNNVLLVQRRKGDVSTTEIPSISLNQNKFKKFDDPREAIQTYLSEELSIEPDTRSLTPFASYYTEKSLTDEQILVYYCKVRRYYDEDDEDNVTAPDAAPIPRDHAIRYCTIDELIDALASNVISDPASGASQQSTTALATKKNKLALTDSVSISALSKFIIDRHEHISNAREYFVKIRFAAIGVLFGAALMIVLIGVIPK